MAWWMAIPAVLSGISAAKGLLSGNKGSSSGGYAGDEMAGSGADIGSSSGFSLGSVGNVLGSVGNWAKKNPLAVMMGLSMLGSVGESKTNRKLSEAQRAILQQQLRDMQNNAQTRQMAQQALGRMFSSGPYARTLPDVSDIYGGG